MSKYLCVATLNAALCFLLSFNLTAFFEMSSQFLWAAVLYLRFVSALSTFCLSHQLGRLLSAFFFAVPTVYSLSAVDDNLLVVGGGVRVDKVDTSPPPTMLICDGIKEDDPYFLL